MKQLDKTQKLWLTLGICISLVFVYSGLVIYPQTSNLLEINNKIYKEKVKLAEQNIQENDLRKIKEREKDVDSILNQLSVHLTTNEDILDFIVELEGIAKESNNKQEITIKQEDEKTQVKNTEKEETPANDNSSTNASTPGQNETAKKQEFLEVQVKLTGTYETLVNYLDLLGKTVIIADQENLESQLSGLTLTPTNKQTILKEDVPKGNEIYTILNLKVFLKATINTNAQ